MMFLDDAVSRANYVAEFEGLTNVEAGIKGLLVALTGMLMVFFMLTLLMFLVKLLGWCISRPAKSKKTEDKSDVADDSAKVSDVVTPVSEEPAQDDKALVAVITAAVAAFRESQGIPADNTFRVVSFKKAQKIRK